MTNTLYSQLDCQQRIGILESCQSSRLIFEPSRLILIHGISRLIPWPNWLMAGLIVSFSRSVLWFELDSGFLYSKVVVIRIDEVCLELGEFYAL